MNKILKWVLIVVACFFGLIIVLGFMKGVTNTESKNQANNEPNKKIVNVETQPEPTKQTPIVQTIGQVWMTAKNWDADPQVDGLKFYLNPKDKDDSKVDSAGVLSMKLWKMVEVNYETKCLKRDGDLLDSWDNLPIKEEDYGIFGAEIKAEYKNYKGSSDKYAQGCAEVTFTTQDGKSFESYEENIWINGI